MTPERLKHLASRAALGLLTMSEQREVMEFICVCASDAHYWAAQASAGDDMERYGLLSRAAQMPPIRKRCDKCGGDGSRKIYVTMAAPNGLTRVQCKACNGTGYAESP